jgi:hypothetical protein
LIEFLEKKISVKKKNSVFWEIFFLFSCIFWEKNFKFFSINRVDRALFSEAGHGALPSAAVNSPDP